MTTTATKVIFLDIDGVMKPGRSYLCPKRADNRFGGFDPLAIAAVNRICERTGAMIMFNTTWNNLGIGEIAIEEGINPEYILGKTNYPNMRPRLEAIQECLAREDLNIGLWVALDDCPIDHANAILIEPDDGITAQNYRDACDKLGVPDPFMLLL